MGHKGTQVPRFKPFTQFWLVFIYLYLSEASTAIVISVFNLFKRTTKILNMWNTSIYTEILQHGNVMILEQIGDHKNRSSDKSFKPKFSSRTFWAKREPPLP